MELTVWGGSLPPLLPLTAEFPAVRFTEGTGEAPAEALRAEVWEAPGFDFWAFDRGLDALVEEGRPLLLAAALPARLPRFASEVLTRAQRRLDRRNAASGSRLFARALALHRALHTRHGLDDPGRPLVRADYDHALDVWQWTLRLAPEAGLAVQLAALLHDVERLLSEADRRIEPTASDAGKYGEFKHAHARRGAQLADELLVEAGDCPALRARVAGLIAGHEGGQTADPDLSLLADADALSFFSLNSPGFLRYYGPEPTRRKVAFTLGRMSPAARARLAGLRLLPEIANLADIGNIGGMADLRETA
jgi:hypothetical protein